MYAFASVSSFVEQTIKECVNEHNCVIPAFTLCVFPVLVALFLQCCCGVCSGTKPVSPEDESECSRSRKGETWTSLSPAMDQVLRKYKRSEAMERYEDHSRTVFQSMREVREMLQHYKRRPSSTSAAAAQDQVVSKLREQLDVLVSLHDLELRLWSNAIVANAADLFEDDDTTEDVGVEESDKECASRDERFSVSDTETEDEAKEPPKETSSSS